MGPKLVKSVLCVINQCKPQKDLRLARKTEPAMQKASIGSSMISKGSNQYLKFLCFSTRIRCNEYKCTFKQLSHRANPSAPRNQKFQSRQIAEPPTLIGPKCRLIIIVAISQISPPAELATVKSTFFCRIGWYFKLQSITTLAATNGMHPNPTNDTTTTSSPLRGSNSCT